MHHKLFDFRSTALLLALAFVALIAGPGAPRDLPDAGLPVADSELAASTRFFPMGWWDHVNAPSRLAGFRSAGQNAVLPYTETGRDVKGYLDRAHSLGMKVFVQIDPLLLTVPNPILVRRFVETYRKHPALYGWLLVDEPTLHDRYLAVTPQVAELLYDQIKAVDTKHPVGIAFGVTEDPKKFMKAMDVLLYDDYVQGAQTHEFWGLGRWRTRLGQRAALASKLKGYIPVLQAFGQDASGKPQYNKRVPTWLEMRYITYTAIQYKATGLFFWVRYRARNDWVKGVLTPLSKEISPALKAMANGPISGAKVVGSAVKATLFRDSTGKTYLVVVHHGDGTVTSQINLSSTLKVTQAWSKYSSVKVSGGKLIDKFGPYAARLYRLT